LFPVCATVVLVLLYVCHHAWQLSMLLKEVA